MDHSRKEEVKPSGAEQSSLKRSIAQTEPILQQRPFDDPLDDAGEGEIIEVNGHKVIRPSLSNRILF